MLMENFEYIYLDLCLALASMMRMLSKYGGHCGTGFFRSVVTKMRQGSAHARILEGILNGELRACVDSRRFFVTTDLKNPVYRACSGESLLSSTIRST